VPRGFLSARGLGIHFQFNGSWCNPVNYTSGTAQSVVHSSRFSSLALGCSANGYKGRDKIIPLNWLVLDHDAYFQTPKLILEKTTGMAAARLPRGNAADVFKPGSKTKTSPSFGLDPSLASKEMEFGSGIRPSRAHLELELELELLWERERRERLEQQQDRERMRVLECILAEGFNSPNHRQNRLSIDAALTDPAYKIILYSLEPDRRHQLACKLWRHFVQNDHSPIVTREYARLLPFIAPITRLPFELLRHILFIAIDEGTQSPLALMAICSHWSNVMSGIWGSLELTTSTTKDATLRRLNGNPLSLEVRVDTESDKESSSSSGAYEGLRLATGSASRWRTLTIDSLPNDDASIGDIQRSRLNQCFTLPMLRLESFKIFERCDQSPLLERLLQAVAATTRNQLDLVQVHCTAAVELLTHPRHAALFRSIRLLDVEAKGGNNLVDLLPHLVQIEDFRASHLRLPTYPLERLLPFVHTIRHLRLKAVSIQWMSGRVFDVLESCTILLPLNHRTLPTRGINLSVCKKLTLRCYPLRTLRAFSFPALDCLEVGCQNLDKRRGDAQLSPLRMVDGVSNLRILHLRIEASEHALARMLSSIPVLEKLTLDLAGPSSLGEGFFADLMAQPLQKQHWDLLPIGSWKSTYCPALVVLELKYGRWMRHTEEFKLARVFAALVWTRRKTHNTMQRFAVIPPADVSACWDFVGEPIISLKAFGLLSAVVNADESGSLDVMARAAVQDILKLPPKSTIYTSPHVWLPQEMSRLVKLASGWRIWGIGKGLRFGSRQP
jgi:hypothetical protein